MEAGHGETLWVLLQVEFSAQVPELVGSNPDTEFPLGFSREILQEGIPSHRLALSRASRWRQGQHCQSPSCLSRVA